ncbi:TIR domain-containing protein [Marinibacterium profundimaris]|uniref:TIR domain-containing protein n=1 Tax=Marinibacterium profundimaris TaxID=1679460 RepID=UPI000B528FC6
MKKILNPIKTSVRKVSEKRKLNRNRGKAFLIHGRDAEAADWLRCCLDDLDVLIVRWEDAVRLPSSASPYTLDVVKTGLNAADIAVVLFSPDEDVSLREKFRSGQQDIGQQARPNVWVEAGMALGLSRDRVVLVQMASCRPASDLSGLNYIYMDMNADRGAFLRILENRLQSCGCRTSIRI